MIGRSLILAVAASAAWAGATWAEGEGTGADVYAEARRQAAHHVQLRIDRVDDLPWYLDQGSCKVHGEVVRVFRGDHARGDKLTIAIDCAKPRARLAPGPLWTAWRAIEQARYVEAYLDADGAVARWQTMLLSEATDEPACPVDTAGAC